jgi:hypothetical protein
MRTQTLNSLKHGPHPARYLRHFPRYTRGIQNTRLLAGPRAVNKSGRIATRRGPIYGSRHTVADLRPWIEGQEPLRPTGTGSY